MYKKQGLGANSNTAKAAYKKQFNFSMYANKVIKVDKSLKEEQKDHSPADKVNTDGNWTVKSYEEPTEVAHNDSEVNIGEEYLDANLPLKELESIELQRSKIRDFLTEKFNSKQGLSFFDESTGEVLKPKILYKSNQAAYKKREEEPKKHLSIYSQHYEEKRNCFYSKENGQSKKRPSKYNKNEV